MAFRASFLPEKKIPEPKKESSSQDNKKSILSVLKGIMDSSRNTMK